MDCATRSLSFGMRQKPFVAFRLRPAIVAFRLAAARVSSFGSGEIPVV